MALQQEMCAGEVSDRADIRRQNFLRKATYRDYYNDFDISFTENEVKIRRHLGMLISMLLAPAVHQF
jgi:hypothetical protein